jgi:hypothetical protein
VGPRHLIIGPVTCLGWLLRAAPISAFAAPAAAPVVIPPPVACPGCVA